MEIYIAMKEKIELLPRAMILYLVFIVLMIIVISLKSNYYIDEIYSYGLSNYTGDGINITFEYDKTYTPGASVFWDYMEVQSGERFDYSSVWTNQTNDVHPPLYYAALHTICSVFPNTFSKWYAGIINMVSALLVLFVMRKLIRLLTESKYILTMISFSFVALTGILLAVSYFRMYVMAMLWVTLLAYLFAEQVDEKQNFKFYGFIYAVTVAGALTHYYVIVYAFLISCVYGSYLLWNERIKEILLFCVTMALAAGTSVAVFPAMIEHMFFGYRGTEAIDNLIVGRNGGYWESLKIFFTLLNQQVFGNLLGYILIGLAILTAVRYSEKDLRAEGGFVPEDGISLGMERKIKIRYALLLIPCFLYFMLVAKMSFVTADRYIVPVYAVSFAGVICMTYKVLEYFLKNKAFIIGSIVMSALLIGGSYTSSGWLYLYRDSRPFLAEAEAKSNYDCICVFEGDSWLLLPEFAEYCNYKSITFITLEELNKDGIHRLASPDGIVVSFVGYSYNLDEAVQKLVQENGYEGCTKLGTFGFDNTYFLYN